MSAEDRNILSGEIAENVRSFIHTELLNEQGEPAFSVDQDLLTEAIVDSLGFMRLTAFLESHYGLSIPMQDVTVENFTSCLTIAEYLQSRQIPEQ